MAVVRNTEPEAVSLAIRELAAEAVQEPAAAAFFAWLQERGVLAQYILYSAEDIRRFDDLIRRGVLPEGPKFVLFVLGRYSRGQTSQPRDLLPFLEANGAGHPWMVCAFGARETACAVAAAALGGHVRVGFENNLFLPAGVQAPDNAALVAAAARGPGWRSCRSRATSVRRSPRQSAFPVGRNGSAKARRSSTSCGCHCTIRKRRKSMTRT